MDELARVLLEAAHVRGKSWDTFTNTYTVNTRRAILKATSDPDVGELAMILLTHCWREALEWANEHKECSQKKNKRETKSLPFDTKL